MSRANLRFGDGTPDHIFDSDVVAHPACWRGGLQFSATKHAEYWEPQSPRMKQIEGLGSYSSYLGTLTDPADPQFAKMCVESLFIDIHTCSYHSYWDIIEYCILI